MPAEIALNTPLAEALTNAIQPKLVEVGWGTGGADDSALAEYIILMLVNGKTENEIATELAGDLLSLGSDDPAARDFAKWLFEQVAALGPDAKEGEAAGASDAINGGQDGDVQMDTDAPAIELSAPTGPKAMRNGPNPRGGGAQRRMVGHINRAMDRTQDPVLHRTRGNDRVNSHGRTPPGGPRGGMGRQPRGGNMNMNMNTRAASIAHGMATAMGGGMPPGGPSAMNPMNGVPMPGMNNGWMGPGGPGPDQLPPMGLYQMLEQQNQMMQQMQQQINQQMMMQRHGQNGNHHASGKPLSERVQHPRQNNGFRKGQQFHQNGGSFPKPSSDAVDGGNGGDDVDMTQQPKRDPKETVCTYNLSCTNKECKFAHQSPAAPPGTTVDVTDTCSFGVACKNHKCVGSHPSPATKAAHQGEQDCKFWPNCTNPSCTFKHPTMPPCRNGADCSVPGCRFTHAKTMCRYRPCKNRFCPFKHEEGQRGTFQDKVWTAGGGGQPGEHVSERKFADEEAPVETILPGQDSDMGTAEGVAAV